MPPSWSTVSIGAKPAAGKIDVLDGFAGLVKNGFEFQRNEIKRLNNPFVFVGRKGREQQVSVVFWRSIRRGWTALDHQGSLLRPSTMTADFQEAVAGQALPYSGRGRR
jgi:hypothetical protein